MKKLSNDELKAIFHGITQAIDNGHIAEEAAHELKERMRHTLMDFLAEQRGPMTSASYKASIIKKAAESEKDKTNYLTCEKCGAGSRSGVSPDWVNTAEHTLCPKCKAPDKS